jgi:hypothetical protein
MDIFLGIIPSIIRLYALIININHSLKYMRYDSDAKAVDGYTKITSLRGPSTS